MSDFQKKESGMEKDFVAKAEREALKSLVRKMEAEADPGHVKALKALEDKLSASGVKITEQMKKDLLAWRHAAH